MDTLKNIEDGNKKYMTYYKIQCPFCKEYLIIPQNELNFKEEDLIEKTFESEEISYDENGKLHLKPKEITVKVPKDKETVAYTIKCCNCGSYFETLQKDTYDCLCDSFGETNYKIEFTDKMTEQQKAFIKKHKNCSQKKLNRPFFTALGQQYTYTITPGGLGDCVSIKCNVCGETEDLTDVDSW